MPTRVIVHTLTTILLVGVLFGIPACAQQRTKVLLTDAALDSVRAGVDLCGAFGINGPCVGSVLQIYDPALPSNPSCGGLPGTSTNCVSSLTSSPLPPGGSVTLQQSFRVDGPATFQSVSQTNTANNLGNQLPFKVTCFTCLHPADLNRAPGRW